MKKEREGRRGEGRREEERGTEKKKGKKEEKEKRRGEREDKGWKLEQMKELGETNLGPQYRGSTSQKTRDMIYNIFNFINENILKTP